MYEIALILKYDGYRRGLARVMYKFFDKKKRSAATSKAGVNVIEMPA